MSKIGIFYASSTGNTKDMASLIKEKFSQADVTLYNVADCEDDAMKEYEFIIMGTSTWGEGDLQDDWEDYLSNIADTDFSSKTVAFFGLGDQEEYCDNYTDAMGILYDEVAKQGANIVGSWETDGYDFEESNSLRDGKFVGLALDEDNQDELSEQRVTTWVEQISPSFIK